MGIHVLCASRVSGGGGDWAERHGDQGGRGGMKCIGCSFKYIGRKTNISFFSQAIPRKFPVCRARVFQQNVSATSISWATFAVFVPRV